MVRLIRLRLVARRQFFLDIAMPSLALPWSLLRHNTVKNLSRLRVAFANTREKAAASSSRLAFENRLLSSLLVNLVVWRVLRRPPGVLRR